MQAASTKLKMRPQYVYYDSLMLIFIFKAILKERKKQTETKIKSIFIRLFTFIDAKYSPRDANHKFVSRHNSNFISQYSA